MYIDLKDPSILQRDGFCIQNAAFNWQFSSVSFNDKNFLCLLVAHLLTVGKTENPPHLACLVYQ